MNLTVCILAAGQGKRMNSDLPKVLHTLADKPLVGHVIDTAREISPQDPIVVYGSGGSLLPEAFQHDSIVWVEQREQLGTGHAVGQALTHAPSDTMFLILYGDVPLIRSSTLLRLVGVAESTGFGLLTAVFQDPHGYGRIVRSSDGEIIRVVEEKDASPAERAVTEINTGIMAIKSDHLRRWIPSLSNKNAQGEYYLTDCVALAVGEGIEIASISALSVAEVTGINDRAELATLERQYQNLAARELMECGVTLRDPSRVDIRGELTCGRDVEIDINSVFIGKVILGNRVTIGPNCIVENAVLGDDVELLANCVIESAEIGSESRIGPFARVRPGSVFGSAVHIGNFVEVKNSRVGDRSKINHLSYVGDSEIGHNVNVGAGTITCNYDGVAKHTTVIEDDVFVGSGTQLVAPVTVGRGATIGAGTTVTADVGAQELVVSRVKQKAVPGWSRSRKKNK